MKIVLNGVETNNKGAELMLYAILQEIERRYPDATVILPSDNIKQGYKYIKTDLKFKDLPYSHLFNPIKELRIPGILRHLHLPYLYLSDFRIISHVDYFIDGSGFFFSDQWNISNEVYNGWKYRLQRYKKQGTKIIFLPQAFGPIQKKETKLIANLISKTATHIYPREQKSFDYLINSGVDSSKLKIFPDFTSLVEGEIPKKYRFLKGKVCIIPNIRMIDKGFNSTSEYVNQMKEIIEFIRSEGFDVYLLNHEGIGDENLCHQIKRDIKDIEIVTGLNALEVKGLISSSYACISSRFHGLVSALNSCVPCLSAGWSHKYEELFKDYCIKDGIFDINNLDDSKKKIKYILNPETNKSIRQHLENQVKKVKNETNIMWQEIWGGGN